MKIQNELCGHVSGGHGFETLKPRHASYVTLLQVWTHNGPGNHEVLRGIRLSWDSGERESHGTTSGRPQDEAVFAKHERITEMIIWAGSWVDAISYKSTYLPQGRRLGGRGGRAYIQDKGNGDFLGFHGRAGSSIDALGSIFEIWRYHLCRLLSSLPRTTVAGLVSAGLHRGLRKYG
ncbi:hypothetical protein F4861DRAFT_518591 [Xylaria intraflava]|nr:hypothetical protein F4861DRAFT_518591 [Xylaria intraflava]